MDIISKEKPRFFGCEGDESREAYQLVLKSGIDCEIYVPSDVESPKIRDGYTRYTGIEEIKDFIEKYKNNIAKQSAIFQKINIETIRYPTENNNEYVSLRGLVSLISFSKPIKDFKGEENSRLCLKTTWFGQGGYYWDMWLENTSRSCICWSKNFNELNEHFSSYSSERLKQWQDVAIKKHRESLLKIEDLYWQGGEISKDFL